MTEEEAKGICEKIRQIAYGLHVYLGVGFLEKVYENALAHRLEKAGMNVSTQIPIVVRDEDVKATGIEHGFLVNFGSYRFECQKFVLRNATSRSIDGV